MVGLATAAAVVVFGIGDTGDDDSAVRATVMAGAGIVTAVTIVLLDGGATGDRAVMDKGTVRSGDDDDAAVGCHAADIFGRRSSPGMGLTAALMSQQQWVRAGANPVQHT